MDFDPKKVISDPEVGKQYIGKRVLCSDHYGSLVASILEGSADGHQAIVGTLEGIEDILSGKKQDTFKVTAVIDHDERNLYFSMIYPLEDDQLVEKELEGVFETPEEFLTAAGVPITLVDPKTPWTGTPPIIYLKDGNGAIAIVTSVSASGISLAGDPFKWEDLARASYTFLNGRPCKKV